MTSPLDPRPAPRARADIAYSLDVVVVDEQAQDVSLIAAAAPGPVVTQSRELAGEGWARIRLMAADEVTLHWLQNRLHDELGFQMITCSDVSIDRSRGGKTRSVAKVPLMDTDDLAFAYTPGVGRVAQRIAADPAAVDQLTGKRNRVAIVTDGSAVLGLGNLGPSAALPVMEGKAALFAELASIDAVPICLATQSVDEIVTAVTAIAPSFGGINLEDISAPRCFAIEAQLREVLDIPVLHDDQHGTATVVLAALQNALKINHKTLDNARIVVLGAGAAGTAVTHLLLAAGARDVVVWVPVGVLHSSIADKLPPHKQHLAANTNPRGVHGGIEDALKGADAVIGVSAAHVLDRRLVALMAKDPIVFVLANPVPEIDPAELTGIASVIATGRSDFPNQVNNALIFPGLFRGALDSGLTTFDTGVLLACAQTLAAMVPAPRADWLLPSVLDPRVVPEIAATVSAVAIDQPKAGWGLRRTTWRRSAASEHDTG